MPIWVGRGKNEQGATLAVVAVSLAAILAMGAISVDLAMLLKAHNDAQRTADAAALAGASAYLDGDASDVGGMAVDRALDYAARNEVAGATLDTSGRSTTQTGDTVTVRTHEAAVEAVASAARVRVTIRKQAIGTMLARTLGVDAVTVAASATAAAVDASAAGCVMPFAIPDLWEERSQPPEDVDGDQVLDEGEDWTFDPAVDFFAPFRPGALSTDPQTGYGSGWRNNQGDVAYRNDYGRPVFLKLGSFRLWNFADNGEATIEDRIQDCDPRRVTLGPRGEQVIVPGDLSAIQTAVQALIDRDGARTWDQSTMNVTGDWRASPRVVRVALYEPRDVAGLSPGQPITFNNVALLFLEQVDAQQVSGRFLYYASGGADGSVTGPLVKTLRLVQ